MEEINKNLIKVINKKVSIYQLIISCGINLKKTGKNFMGLCPFHSEKTPSFSVSPEKNIALCMSCLKGGGPVKFFQQYKKLSINETVLQLSEKFNINISYKNLNFFKNPLYQILEDTLEYYRQSLNSFFRSDIEYFFSDKKEKYKTKDLKNLLRNDIEHPLTNYLQERKLSFEIIEEFKLGFADSNANSLTNYLLKKKKHNLENLIKLSLIKKKENKEEYYDFFKNRLIFPLNDSKGQIVGFVGRSINTQNSKEPKYLFNTETPLFKKNNLLYRLFEHNNFIKEKKEVILCEGFFDVISFFKINKKNTVSTMGTNLNQTQINNLKKITQNILIAYDGDEAGIKAAFKISFFLNRNGFKIKILFFPENLDPDQYINEKKNYLDLEKLNFILESKSKDFILLLIEKILIEQKKNQNKNINEIKKDIRNLLQFHNDKNKEYYQEQIYKKHQLYIDFKNNNNDNYQNIDILNNKKIFNILTQKYKNPNIKNIIENIEKNNISINEIKILNDIFLNKEYISFVRDNIVRYISNPVIIEIIDKVKEYYDNYASKEELTNGVNIDNFVKVYNIFLNKLNLDFNVYNLLLEIRQSLFFIRKKRIENQEDLNIFYLNLGINNINKKIEKIKKNIEILKKKLSQEENENQIKKIFIDIQKENNKIKEKKKEINEINKKIRNYTQFKKKI
jgi:DNA primase